MRKKIHFLFTIFFCLISFTNVFASVFSKNKTQGISGNQPQEIKDEIQAPLEIDKILQRRQSEAHKLIFEGNKLIKKGEKKKDQNLITKGQIKKEIGEKQLQVIKEQIENRKSETSGW